MATRKRSLPELKEFLDAKVMQYNSREFIATDPVLMPHRFTKKQDIEIAGFLAATLAWGQRVTIINKCNDLLERMGNAPHDFLLHHQEQDLKSFEKFKHRTFNATDVLYFIESLSHYYKKHDSLEDAFLPDKNSAAEFPIASGLIKFHNSFFSLPDFPLRTLKHVSTPEKKSACKRLNMYLRWMVRKDDKGVDFGIWKRISPSQLVCPCDVHVERVARKLGLIRSKQVNWQMAEELTRNLRMLDSTDPVKYDFALFGLGVAEQF
jgi:uncharacterized protein (TIGR02757 family)